MPGELLLLRGMLPHVRGLWGLLVVRGGVARLRLVWWSAAVRAGLQQPQQRPGVRGVFLELGTFRRHVPGIAGAAALFSAVLQLRQLRVLGARVRVLPHRTWIMRACRVFRLQCANGGLLH